MVHNDNDEVNLQAWVGDLNPTIRHLGPHTGSHPLEKPATKACKIEESHSRMTYSASYCLESFPSASGVVHARLHPHAA
jgi:hypothetical protein